MTRICAAFFAVAVFVQTVIGQETDTDWRLHVIPIKERSFDFKTTAKGAIPKHQFVLRNPLIEPIHIGGITSSCDCTTLDFDREKIVLNTYEELVITAWLRGDRFEGQRNATITVVIDKPSSTEIQLNVRGEIRTDLTITPEFIDFGNAELGKELSRTLTVTYRGSNTQWRLVDTQCENKFIRTEITGDPARSGIGSNGFKVKVSLDKSAPNGSINTHLILISNDTEFRREIPISLRATVGTVIGVSSAAVSLGVLPPGKQSPMKNVVIRGTKPFRITKIESDNPAIDIPLKISAEEPPQILYAVPFSYLNPLDGEGAPGKDGIMRTEVRITTDVPGLVPTFYVIATVLKSEEELPNPAP